VVVVIVAVVVVVVVVVVEVVIANMLFSFSKITYNLIKTTD
jgi:hypothetical protein